MFEITKDKKFLLVHKDDIVEHDNGKLCECKPIIVEICDELTAVVIQEELDKGYVNE